MTPNYPLQTNAWIQILEKSVVSDQERPEFLNILCKMCSRQRSIPTSMVIMNCDDEEPNPARIGGHADVFRGVHRGCRVAIKVLRVNSGNPDRQHVGLFVLQSGRSDPNSTTHRGSVEKPLLGNTSNTQTFCRYSVRI